MAKMAMCVCLKVIAEPANRTNEAMARKVWLRLTQILLNTCPKPLRPPQMMKFQLAPCHQPPTICVAMAFMFVEMNLRESGLK